MSKPLEILVCNDDGHSANGIFALAQAMKAFGKVTVVAPDSPQSGMGHAISIAEPLRLSKVAFDPDIDAYACTGTPVDCVKLATGVILKRKPDLLVSGINHGLNSSISVFYSGTMSAAVEGAIEGIPAIGFSLDDFGANADFSASAVVATTIVKSVLEHTFPPFTALNVNIPRLPLAEIKGIKITRQALGRWVEEFEARVDPYGRNYYWLTGQFQLDDDGEDTDIWALQNGFVSVCPVEIDATAHHNLAILHGWNLKLA
jgi:5'-nucleotidase